MARPAGYSSEEDEFLDDYYSVSSFLNIIIIQQLLSRNRNIKPNINQFNIQQLN